MLHLRKTARKIVNPLTAKLKGQLHPGKYFVPSKQDIILCSYPKSGNTWLRAMLTAYHQPAFGLDQLNYYVPDIYSCTLNQIQKSFIWNESRVFKSHESFRPDYRRLIYIYRDPRDVLVSYYHYKRRGETYTTRSFLDFATKFLSGDIDTFGSWQQNVESWLRFAPHDTLFLSYESIRENPAAAISAVLLFLGQEISDSHVSSIVEQTRFDMLRNREARSHSLEFKTSETSSWTFFRSGSTRQWKQYPHAPFAELSFRWGNIMTELGYEP